MTCSSEQGWWIGVTAEEWVLAATAFLSGLASGLLGMLSTIMRPMLAAMDGRDFRNFMEEFLRYAGHSWGKVYNFAWSGGMTIGPIVALVLLRDDPAPPRSYSPRSDWAS
jgi:MFS family permease